MENRGITRTRMTTPQGQLGGGVMVLQTLDEMAILGPIAVRLHIRQMAKHLGRRGEIVVFGSHAAVVDGGAD